MLHLMASHRDILTYCRSASKIMIFLRILTVDKQSCIDLRESLRMIFTVKAKVIGTRSMTAEVHSSVCNLKQNHYLRRAINTGFIFVHFIAHSIVQNANVQYSYNISRFTNQ